MSKNASLRISGRAWSLASPPCTEYHSVSPVHFGRRDFLEPTLTQNPPANLREIPESVREALAALGIPADDIPVVVPADAYDQAVFLTQYRHVDLSAPVPFVHRVASMPHAPDHSCLASVVSAMLAASRLSPRGVFQLVVGTHTVECGLGHIFVRPARHNEGRPVLSGPL